MDKVVLKNALETIRRHVYDIEDAIVELDEMICELEKEIK